jgi:FMN phosphatase YigB (HAD superfamily)
MKPDDNGRGPQMKRKCQLRSWKWGGTADLIRPHRLEIICGEFFMGNIKTILVDAMDGLVVDGQVDQKMKEILDSFPNRKIILTNANAEQREEFLPNMPYEMFSLDHSPNKTDGGYYEKMLDHFDLKAEDCIYFEHNKDAVAKAKELGIRGYHFDHEERDLAKLEEFLKENL